MFLSSIFKAADSVHPDAEPCFQPIHRGPVPTAAGWSGTDDRATRARPIHRRSDLRRRQQPDAAGHRTAQCRRDDVREGTAP